MSLRDTLDLFAFQPARAGGRRSGISAPPEWSDGTQLARLFWEDVFGPDVAALATVNRERAMGIPSLLRARNILCTVLGQLPLRTYTGDTPTDPVAPWCQRTSGPTSPFHRTVWTVDDLLFHGGSLWSGTRAAGPAAGWLELHRVAYDRWEWDDDDQLFTVDDQTVDQSRLIYIPGFSEGVLATSQVPLRTAAALNVMAAESARTPFKLELHQLSGDELTDAERSALVGDARKALASNMGVLFTNPALQAIVHPVDSAQLVIEGRNASAVDMARIAGLPASLVDATAAGASLTYETARDRNRQAVDYGFAGYIAAIQARLSQDDVVPRGQRTAFDLTGFTNLAGDPATGTPPTATPLPLTD